MATRGKSINLFLMDGDPRGRIKCMLANWTGVTYKIPRTELEKCEKCGDLSQSGIYFLFGTSDQTDKEGMVYIGQAAIRKNNKGILHRLQEHRRDSDKDYWTEAVVFTTSNNWFGATEISYLENSFYNLAIKAKRYEVKNGNAPTKGNITEEKESELEEFVDYAKIVMGTLGHKLFESLRPVSTPDPTANKPEMEALPLYVKGRGADAQAMLTSEGLVVLAGSIIRKKVDKSCPESAKKVRADNKDNIDEDSRLTKDLLFGSPSGASAFVLGASTNGNAVWKTADGKSLKEVEASESAVQEDTRSGIHNPVCP
ncbi:MAG: GIY-YIG nuclease family protein [Verrucomicrobiota bacterium]|jgi:hypothetical protein|nr:GIY-YIG nuclease family protein [Verrucomicrobiota bacterium]